MRAQPQKAPVKGGLTRRLLQFPTTANIMTVCDNIRLHTLWNNRGEKVARIIEIKLRHIRSNQITAMTILDESVNGNNHTIAAILPRNTYTIPLFLNMWIKFVLTEGCIRKTYSKEWYLSTIANLSGMKTTFFFFGTWRVFSFFAGKWCISMEMVPYLFSNTGKLYVSEWSTEMTENALGTPQHLL